MSLPTLVVRFSSLGDVVLAGAVTGALAPVVFVTLRPYAAVAARLPGVVQVVAVEEGEGLGALARRLPAHGRRIDLHRSLRSQALALALGGTWDLVDAQRLRRHMRVAVKVAPARSLVQRYSEAAGVVAAAPPWIAAEGPRDALLVVPGARHASKRWPPERFAAALAPLEGPVMVLGGPGEERACTRIADALGPRAEVLCEAGFERTFAALGRGRACLADDTGLAHLCAAAGIPVVTVFGGTTAADGYWDARCMPLEQPLWCRPCSRFGRDTCPIGDWACLWELAPERATAALRSVLE
ncbi:MAG: glycosyltransferase family 9 protein [Pseudomonadota bacterium]